MVQRNKKVLKARRYCELTSHISVSLNRFSDQEIDDMLHGAPVDSKGMFDYVKFTRIIKHGKDDD